MTTTPTSIVPDLILRPRRLRRSAAMRALVAETSIRPEHLIAPFFVVPGSEEEQPIDALPGVSRWSVDTLLPQLERALGLGVKAAVLFGVVPANVKTPNGAAAADRAGPVASALRAAREAFGEDLVLITDVCLCGYTDHGHCGLLAPRRSAVSRGTDGRGPASHGAAARIDNDASLVRLAEMALAHAEAGADLVSPSDMMDGRVAALRTALDGSGFDDVGILSYAVKYASAFYGPFREAAGSAPSGGNRGANEDGNGGPEGGGSGSPTAGGRSGNGAMGADASSGDPAVGSDPAVASLTPPKDRATYQMDSRNVREGLREASLDEAEGADMLMVKPALPYLDVIAKVRAQTTLPVVAYNVSGEYAMIKAAAAAGALDEPLAVRETLHAIRRAGADLIFTYHALDALEEGWLA